MVVQESSLWGQVAAGAPTLHWGSGEDQPFLPPSPPFSTAPLLPSVLTSGFWKTEAKEGQSQDYHTNLSIYNAVCFLFFFLLILFFNYH